MPDDYTARAIEVLLADHGHALVRYAFQLTHDRQLAEDLLQDALLSCYRTWRRRGLPAEEAHTAYVRRTVTRSYLRTYRKWTQHSLPADAAMLSAAVDEQVSNRITLWTVLELLPPRERAAVVLHHYLDYTHAQAAAHIGCRESTARSLCHRGLNRARQLLDLTTATEATTPGVHQEKIP